MGGEDRSEEGGVKIRACVFLFYKEIISVEIAGSGLGNRMTCGSGPPEEDKKSGRFSSKNLSAIC